MRFPPHSPHFNRPLNKNGLVTDRGSRPRFWVCSPSNERNRCCTRSQSSCGTMARSVRSLLFHSFCGRGLLRRLFVPGTFSNFERFQITSPLYNSRFRMARIAVGHHEARRPARGRGGSTHSAFSFLAIAFSDRPLAEKSKILRTVLILVRSLPVSSMFRRRPTQPCSRNNAHQWKSPAA